MKNLVLSTLREEYFKANCCGNPWRLFSAIINAIEVLQMNLRNTTLASDKANTSIGKLKNLTTTDKSNIVNAINEINAKPDSSDLFYVTYGVTPYSEILDAANASKLPICKDNERIFVYFTHTRQYIDFANVDDERIMIIRVTTANEWQRWSENLELSGRKVQQISEDSTTEQYPSAKAVYDYAINDVRINGTSITGDDGVADIPVATSSSRGVVGFNSAYGIAYNNSIPALVINSADSSRIDDRNTSWDRSYRAVTPSILDYAVKAALTDGKAPAWTDSEKLACRERIGLGGNFELIEEINVMEAVQTITRTTTPSGKAYNFARVVVEVETGISTGTAPLYVKMNNLAYTTAILWNVITTAKKYCVAYLEVLNGRWLAVSLNAGSPGSATSPAISPYSFLHESAPSISKLTMTASAAVPIPVGTVIKIYGVWA